MTQTIPVQTKQFVRELIKLNVSEKEIQNGLLASGFFKPDETLAEIKAWIQEESTKLFETSGSTCSESKDIVSKEMGNQHKKHAGADEIADEHREPILTDVDETDPTERYIVIFPVFNSEEVYYCKTLEEVQRTIKATAISEEEIAEVRLFEVLKEIDVKNLMDS